MTGDLAGADASRFEAWQRDAIDARPAGSELLRVGPFTVVVPAGGEPGAWVTIVDAPVAERETLDAVPRLRSIFQRHPGELAIEYNQALFPQVGRWLEAAGLTLAERNPLMACRPASFKPYAAPDVTLQRLTRASSPAEKQAFQTIRWTDGGDTARAVPPVERLDQELASPTSAYILASVGGVPAGTGVVHPLRGAAEIVGVVTRADMRRRGVAATVTSDLVARHFASGGDFVFLDAADEGAARVYLRLGFATFGANVVYRPSGEA